MGFSRRSRPVPRQGGVARLWSLCHGLMMLASRLVLTVAALALIAAAIVYLRLLQGPIAMPGMARMLVQQVNEANAHVQVDVGDVVLTLGEGAASSGLQFLDVELRSPAGQPLLAAARVGARFHLSDLLHGRLQPVRITLIEPDAQVIRAPDGRVRLGMGTGRGVPLPQGAGAGEKENRFAMIAALLDGVVGDRPPVPELARLERIEIRGANLTFDDRRSGSHWSTEHADLRLWRYPGGARATLDIRPADGAGAALGIAADRPAGPGRTDLRLQFDAIDSGRLASHASELDWLRLIGGTVAGEASVTLERDGTISALEGVVVAEDGTLRGLGEPLAFDAAELHFRTDQALDRLEVEHFRLRAAAFSTTLFGYADLDRAADGTVQGLDGRFAVGGLRLDLPDQFAAPLAFDGGRLTARWSLPDQRIELTDARLVQGALGFTVAGEVRARGKGWIADLSVEGEGGTVDDLVAFWPVSRAANARSWIDEHITDGAIDRLSARLRLGDGEPQVALDFDYSGLRVDYVDGMSPVEDARGTGHVTFHELHMQLESGRLVPPAGGPVELAGSRLAIRGFWGSTPPAEIWLKAEGPIGSALEIIDQPPLRLMRRLDRRLNPIDGQAAVEVDLVIPLLMDLRLADIGVVARAGLSDVSTLFAIAPERSVDLRAERLELTADAAGLHLSGGARIEGAPVSIDWREEYGAGRDGRTIDLAGQATAALLAAVGADGLPVEGAPPFELTLRQAGGGPLAFTLGADLTPARVEIGALDWIKPPGTPARLTAQGTQRQGVEFTTLTLDSLGLYARGALRLDAGGRLVHAAFEQVRLPGRGTFAATLHTAPDGVLEVGLSGRELDLTDRLDGQAGSAAAGAGGGGAATPVRLRLEVGQLRLGERIALAPATGTVEQHATGAVDGRFDGRLGAAPVTLAFDVPDVGPGTLRMTSPDAGAVLRAAGFYSDAEGGGLTLLAQIGGDDGGDGAAGLRGEARIDDVRVRSQSTFRTMLRDGGLDSAEQAVSSGGIGFRKVVIPFTYLDGRLRLTNAIASSPLLALKVNGTVDERADLVDLAGVLSPAYGLTGALNEVPLLGQILGGEGEGVLAMTFRMRGPIADPRFTINPLSMLAPGFLRKIFAAPGGEVSEEFRDNLTRPSR